MDEWLLDKLSKCDFDKWRFSSPQAHDAYTPMFVKRELILYICFSLLFCLISGVLFQSTRKNSGVYGRIHLFNSACLASYQTSH